ncbi:MAG TPA: SGNH/GDSL hydrolase family protein [bacterium]
MRKLIPLSLLALHGLLLIIVFAGFLFPAQTFRYSTLQVVVLSAVLLLLAAVPIAVYFYKKSVGWRGLAYSVIPAALLAAAVYFALMMRFYYVRQYPFDPFLQMPPPTSSDLIEAKSDSAYRLLFLGGSTTKNVIMPVPKRYPSVCRDILQQRYSDRKIELFNAGQDWYTTKHILIHYVTYCADWQPDLVVIIEGINDLCRSFSPSDYALGRYKESWSHFYGPASRGANPPSYETYLWRRFCDWVQNSWYGRFRFRSADYPLDRFVSLPQFEGNLRKIVRAVRSSGAQPILVCQPSFYKPSMTGEELRILGFGMHYCYRTLPFGGREYPSAASLAAAMQAFNDVTRRVAREEGALLVDAEAQLPKDLDTFVDDVHYTESGTRHLAEIVAQSIIDAQVIPNRLIKN